MSKTPILITGCQRSGTTLLNLILDSHPDITSIDENDFDYPAINTYLNAPWLPSFISFKLPRYAPVFPFIKSFNDRRVIWCIRDPLDAIWSMVNSQFQLDRTISVSWAAHPNGAQREIFNSYWVLGDAARIDLAQDLKRFHIIKSKSPEERTREECILIGSLCWRIKNELPLLYETENISFHTVKYETLVATPKDTIEKILDYIGTSWSDDVLRHHEMHDGVSIGNTSNTRPIDTSSVGHGAENFTQDEMELIKATCNKVADKWNYNSTN